MAEINLNVLEQSAVMHIKGAFSADECSQAIESILNFKNSTPIFDPNSNLGCWRGFPHMQGGFSEELNEMIIGRLSEYLNQYISSLTKPSKLLRESTDYFDKSRYIFDAWCNVNREGAENREHAHSGYLASGCAYFQSTGTGKIEFIPQNTLYKLTNPAWPYHGMCSYEPEDGDLLLFPSYLLHKVHPNPSSRERINMAFNVNYQRKHTQ